MKRKTKIAGWCLAASSLFAAGYAAGQAQFGMPKSVIHVSLIKWKEGTSETDRMNVIKGVKKMAMKVPGIKNIWITPLRMQPRDFHAAFVIEFKDKEAAIGYIEHPAHEEWVKKYLPLRETSISPQITNEY